MLVSGSSRVNEKTIEEYVGEKITKEDADFTRRMTGFAVDGVPPIGRECSLDTFIDKDLLSFESLWAAAGTPHAVFNLKGADLLILTKGKVISIK